MRITVDSGELEKKIRDVARYTKSGVSDVTSCVLLKTGGVDLVLRATTYDSNCVALVNSMGRGSPGAVATSAKNLLAIIKDTGGNVEIYDENSYLYFDYGDTVVNCGVMAVTEDDFPIWLDVDPIITVNKDIVDVAIDNVLPMEKSGLPIKSCVHFVPREDGKVAVAATTGIYGSRSIIDGELERSMSIEGTMLARAASTIGERIKIGRDGDRVIVYGDDSPYKVSFTTVASPDPTGVAGGFEMQTDDGAALEILQISLLEIGRWCASAARLEEDAIITVVAENGTLEYNISGREINVDGHVPADGYLPKSKFKCGVFSHLFRSMRDAESYNIRVKTTNDAGHFMYINGVDKHLVFCVA